LGGLASTLQAQDEEEVFEEFVSHVTGEDSLSEGKQEVLEEAFGRLREEEREA
jgi:predicted small metal-binding protein